MNNNNRFISLLSDYGFKVTFADESNTLFLRKALQAMIQSEAAIASVQFLRNEQPGTTKEARGSVFDLICVDEKNRTFIVEMQFSPYKNFIQRSKFYAFHQFNTFIEKGQYHYEDIPPIYCIGLLAKGIFPQSNHYYHFGRLKDQEGLEMDDQLTHIIIEIDKFNKAVHRIDTELDILIFTMKHSKDIKKSDQLPEFMEADWIQQALKKLDISQMTPEAYRDYQYAMEQQAHILNQRKKEDQQLVDKTTQKVQQETTRAIKIEQAKKMKVMGMAHEVIVQVTGLSIEEIEQL